MIARSLAAVLLLSAPLLTGCGKIGELDQPAPLFGAQAKADYAAKQQAATDAKARAAAKRSELPPAPNPDAEPLTQAPYAPSIPGRSDPLGPGPFQGPGTTSNQ
jgi:hypothetical protein